MCDYFFEQLNNFEPTADVLCSILSFVAVKLNLISEKRILFNKHINNRWYDVECRLMRNNLFILLRRARRNDDPALFVRYKSQASFYRNLCRRKKISYFDSLNYRLSACRDAKAFWSLVRTKRTDYKHSSCISLKDWYAFFSHLYFSEISEPFVFSSHSVNFGKDVDEILDTEINLSELKWAIGKLRNNKAPGGDYLRSEFFKSLSDTFLLGLVNVFNKIKNSSEFPEKWVEIIIIPVFKRGDDSCPSNYRPISLVPIVTKLFTSILNQRLIC